MIPDAFSTLLKALTLFAGAKLGLGTTFYPVGDPWNPSPFLACYRRDLTNDDLVVAHPKLPCGSRVLLVNLRTKRWTIARVADRGPRHALVDLAPATARALKANGYEQVIMVPLGVEQ